MTSDLTARARALFIQLNGYDAVAADEPIGLSELALIESALRAVREEAAQVAESISSTDLGLTGDQISGGAAMRREIADAIRKQY